MEIRNLNKGDMFSTNIQGRTMFGFVDKQGETNTKVFIYGKGIMHLKSSTEIESHTL